MTPTEQRNMTLAEVMIMLSSMKKPDVSLGWAKHWSMVVAISMTVYTSFTRDEMYSNRSIFVAPFNQSAKPTSFSIGHIEQVLHNQES